MVFGDEGEEKARQVKLDGPYAADGYIIALGCLAH